MILRGIPVSRFLFGLGLFFSVTAAGQTASRADSAEEETYYIAINPVAPFTSIRGEISSFYLPAISNLETGFAIYGGKFWNRHYNVETRFSFGSPIKGYNLLQAQSGFNYCFNTRKRYFRPYAGLFVNLYSFEKTDGKTNESSIITYVCVGNRFVWGRYFLDLRLSEHLYAINWSDLPSSKTKTGFLPSIYKWKSPYVPFAAIGIGYLFK